MPHDLHAHPVEVGADDGADEEDGELEDAEDEAVLGGDAALLLGLVRVEGRLHGHRHGVAEVDHHEGDGDQPLLAAEVHPEHCRIDLREIWLQRRSGTDLPHFPPLRNIPI